MAEWSAPRLTSETLRVQLILDTHGGGKRTSEWHPSKPNPDQLPGTIRTLDKADGATELRCDQLPADQRAGMLGDAHCAMGLVSRSGWALFDDTETGRFDGSASSSSRDGATSSRDGGGWDWAAPLDPDGHAAEMAARRADGDPRCEQWARSGECEANRAFMQSACKPACERAAARASAKAAAAAGSGGGGGPPAGQRLDWYLFAAGHDFRSALSDYSQLSGPPPLLPRYALGVWFSRWWPWSDWEASELLKEFDERGVPCDVLITDMDWHHTCAA